MLLLAALLNARSAALSDNPHFPLPFLPTCYWSVICSCLYSTYHSSRRHSSRVLVYGSGEHVLHNAQDWSSFSFSVTALRPIRSLQWIYLVPFSSMQCILDPKDLEIYLLQ